VVVRDILIDDGWCCCVRVLTGGTRLMRCAVVNFAVFMRTTLIIGGGVVCR
jgi:hypothetical protein